MKMLKNIVSRFHIFLLWLLASVMFWSWIFTIVTDTSPDKKVTVYCHVPAVHDTALAVALEEHMPDGLEMIKVHSFDYVMFDEESISQGDVFIIPASEIELFAGDLAPVGEEQGVMVYEASTGAGVAMDYIQYADEDFYLFLGAGSAHLEDGKALEVAMLLLAMK